jgi:hypothetical protein
VIMNQREAAARHDTGSTTARSVDEVALIRDTISHYVDRIFINPKFVEPAAKKNAGRAG